MILIFTGISFGSTSTKIYTSYQFSGKSEGVRVLKEIKPYDEIQAGEYDLHAKLRLKTRESQVVVNSVDLELPKIGMTAKQMFGRHFSGSDRSFWNRGRNKHKIIIPVKSTPGSKDSPFTQYNEFDEVWIRYRDYDSAKPCQLGIEMVFVAHNRANNTTTTIIASSDMSSSMNTEKIMVDDDKVMKIESADNFIEIKNGNWKEKNTTYLVMRELGIGLDSNWRISRDENDTIIQRRFNKKLSLVESIDIISEKEAKLRHINFRVRVSEKSGGGDENVELISLFGDQIKTVNSENKKLFRVVIKDIIREKFANSEKVILEEIIFFWDDPVNKVLSENLIKGVAFQPIILDETENSYFLKRRFYKNIDEIREMVLTFPIGTPVEAIKLKLNDGKSTGAAEYVSWYPTEKSIANLKNKLFINIDFVEMLRNRKKEKQEIYLEEAIVLLNRDKIKNVQLYAKNSLDTLLEQITFVDMDGVKQVSKDLTTRIRLRTKFQSLPEEKKQFIVDMRNISALTQQNLKLVEFSLLLNDENSKEPAKIEFLEGRIVDIADKEASPEFFLENERLGKKWKGIFNSTSNEKNKVEWIGVDGYLPFRFLTDKGYFRGGTEKVGNISVSADKSSLFHLHESNGEIGCSLKFYEMQSKVQITLSSVGPFDEDRDILLSWKKEPNFKISLINPYLQVSSGNSIKFQLQKGNIPIIEIQPNSDPKYSREGFISGRFTLADGYIFEYKDGGIKSIQISPHHLKMEEDENQENIAKRNANIQEDENQGDALSSDNIALIQNMSKIALHVNKAKSTHGIDIIRTNGIIIRADKDPYYLSHKMESLQIEGRGNWVEIYWPIIAELSDDSFFFMGIENDREDFENIKVILYDENENSTILTGKPNRAISLSGHNFSIIGLKVRFQFASNKYRVGMKEMVLFRSIKKLAKEAALNMPMPWNGTNSLKPVDVSIPQGADVISMPGRILAVLPIGKNMPSLTWNTKFDTKEKHHGRIRLKYSVPDSFVAQYPCWLKIKMQSELSEVEKKICLYKPAGEIVIPIAEQFDLINIRNGINLENIYWEVNTEDHINIENMLIPIDLEMSIEGSYLTSFLDKSRKDPILEYQNNFFFPKELDKIEPIDIINGSIWIKLGPIKINAKENSLSNQMPITFMAHPYFEVESAIIESKLFHENALSEFAEKPLGRDSLTWFPLIIRLSLFFCTCLFLSFMWHIGWINFAWKWLIENKSKIRNWLVSQQIFEYFTFNYFSIDIAKNTFFFICKYLLLIQRTIIIGLVAFNFLLVLSSESEKGMISIILGILVLGISFIANEGISFFYKIKVEKKTNIKPRAEFQMQISVYLFLIVLLLSSFSLLGFYDKAFVFNSWSCIPFISLTLVFTPTLLLCLSEFIVFSSGLIWTMSWGIITFALYGRGIVDIAKNHQNIFFSLGGIVAIFFWRNFYNYFLPKLKVKWPVIFSSLSGKKLYFVGFIVFSSITALLLVLKLFLIAEQLAVVSFYLLLIGVTLESFNYLKYNKKG